MSRTIYYHAFSCSVDGPEGRPRNLNSNSEGQDGKVSDSTDLKQTLPLQLKTEEEKNLRSSPSLERLKFQVRKYVFQNIL